MFYLLGSKRRRDVLYLEDDDKGKRRRRHSSANSGYSDEEMEESPSESRSHHEKFSFRLYKLAHMLLIFITCIKVIVFAMSCYCKCPVALPHGAVGRSAVCDCGFS